MRFRAYVVVKAFSHISRDWIHGQNFTLDRLQEFSARRLTTCLSDPQYMEKYVKQKNRDEVNNLFVYNEQMQYESVRNTLDDLQVTAVDASSI